MTDTGMKYQANQNSTLSLKKTYYVGNEVFWYGIIKVWVCNYELSSTMNYTAGTIIRVGESTIASYLSIDCMTMKLI